MARAKKKGVILITGHCGNWELMSLVFSANFDKCHAVARALNNRIMNQILENIRSLTGSEVIYKEGAIRKILSALRQGQTVGILIDQAVLKDEAVITSFLGRPALTSKLPALLARKTKAPVIPMFSHRDQNGKHIIVIHPEAKLSSSTDQAPSHPGGHPKSYPVRGKLHSRAPRPMALGPSPLEKGLREKIPGRGDGIIGRPLTGDACSPAQVFQYMLDSPVQLNIFALAKADIHGNMDIGRHADPFQNNPVNPAALHGQIQKVSIG